MTDQQDERVMVHLWACKYFNIHPETPPSEVIDLLWKGLRIAFKHEGFPLRLFSKPTN